MILIQQITINWTKRTRGAHGGALRNAIPKAFAVPNPDEEPEPSPLAGGVFLHEIPAKESDEFDIAVKEFLWVRPAWIELEYSKNDPWRGVNLHGSEVDAEAARRGEYEFEQPKDRYGLDYLFPFTFKQQQNDMSLEFARCPILHYLPRRRQIETFKLALDETCRLEINGKADFDPRGLRQEREYQQITYNIHFTDRLNENIFLTHPFDRIIDMKVHLF